MRVAKRDLVYNVHSPLNKPNLSVKQGETFKVETELNGGPWLKRIEDKWEPRKSQGPNLTTVVEVLNSKKGEVLAVEILDIKVDNIGYTGFAGWRLPLSQEILPNDWDVVTKTVAIENGYILWSKDLKLPIDPMIGTIGVAPAEGEISNAIAYRHGGNFDVQEIRKGTTIYLPVNVDGALLHVGDVHAIMGDGEINNGGGIECRGEVTLRINSIEKPASMDWFRAESDEYIMTIACEKDVKKSFTSATRELILWMRDDYGFSEKEAYLLLGQVMEARCTVFVNETYSYICKINKKYLT